MSDYKNMLLTACDNALSQHEFKIVEILDKWEAKNG